MINIRNKKLITKFGIHVKKLRQKKGHTQQSLAEKALVPISQITRIESGFVNPTLSTLSMLSKALKIPLHELMKF